MKKRVTTILVLLVLLAGLSLLLYPTLSDWWNGFHQSRAIFNYSQSVASLSREECESILASARDYNARLLDRADPYALADQDAYDAQLDPNGTGIMCYIEIPSIGCYLPVYHGTDEDVLQTSVGHLEWTSLPVGGESSHAVLSGHRGLPSARLFTDIDRMAAGDLFYLYVLDQVLTYQVDQILTVLPDETESLLIQPGEDLCTLVTCTPYGVNTHRLLVRGHRIPNEEAPAPAHTAPADPATEAPFLAAVIGLPLVAALAVLALVTRKKRGPRNE